MCGGQRATFKSWFSPPTSTRVPGSELRSSLARRVYLAGEPFQQPWLLAFVTCLGWASPHEIVNISPTVLQDLVLFYYPKVFNLAAFCFECGVRRGWV